MLEGAPFSRESALAHEERQDAADDRTMTSTLHHLAMVTRVRRTDRQASPLPNVSQLALTVAGDNAPFVRTNFPALPGSRSPAAMCDGKHLALSPSRPLRASPGAPQA